MLSHWAYKFPKSTHIQPLLWALDDEKSNICLKFRKLARPPLMFWEASALWDQPRNRAPPSKSFGHSCSLYTPSWRPRVATGPRKAPRSPAASVPLHIVPRELLGLRHPCDCCRPPAGPFLQGTALLRDTRSEALDRSWKLASWRVPQATDRG